MRNAKGLCVILTLAHVNQAQRDPHLESISNSVLPENEAWLGVPIYVLEPADPSAGLIRGRYFPSQGIAMVLRHQDDWITIATAVHETAHYMTYGTRCKSHRGSAKCGYVGQHDAGFRRMVAQLYDRAGVPDYARTAVEGGVEA